MFSLAKGRSRKERGLGKKKEIYSYRSNRLCLTMTATSTPSSMTTGGQIVDIPLSNQSTISLVKQFLFFHGTIPILAPLIVFYKFLTDKPFRYTFPSACRSLYSLVSQATMQSISNGWYYQNETLLSRLWSQPSARAYVGALEYQIREGYCGSATRRCILRSFGLSPDGIMEQTRGESKPEGWCEGIAKDAKDSHGLNLSTRIFRPDDDMTYDEFVSTLRLSLSNTNIRVACNFLRSGLMGFERVRYVPIYMIAALFFGHFSPIIGIIEQNDNDGGIINNTDEYDDDYPFVAIFDTNHKYGGVYLTPARKLYNSVKAIDVSSNTHRAIVFVERK